MRRWHLLALSINFHEIALLSEEGNRKLNVGKPQLLQERACKVSLKMLGIAVSALQGKSR
jgi:hypothetical protein